MTRSSRPVTRSTWRRATSRSRTSPAPRSCSSARPKSCATPRRPWPGTCRLCRPAERKLLVGQEPALHRKQAGAGAVRGSDLRVDVLDVVADGLRGDHELFGDLLVGQATSEQLEHLDLARRQPRRALAPPWHAMARSAEHSVDGLRVEPARSYLGAQ